MKLLVTGGAGYISSVVAHQLVEAGHETIVLDNLSKGYEQAVPEGARFIRGDLLDARCLRGVFTEGFDGVLHLAALSAVGKYVQQPERYYRNNLCGTLEAARHDARGWREAHGVFLDDCGLRRARGGARKGERHASADPHPYRGSKLAADNLTGYVAAAHGLAAVSLRHFNVTGARAAASVMPTPPAPRSSR